LPQVDVVPTGQALHSAVSGLWDLRHLEFRRQSRQFLHRSWTLCHHIVNRLEARDVDLDKPGLLTQTKSVDT